MAASQTPTTNLSKNQENYDEPRQSEHEFSHEFDLSSLPREDRAQVYPLYQYRGFWYFEGALHTMFACQRHFKARQTDVILATVPKSGTTWLKALAFALVNRTRFPHPQAHTHPLLTTNPHKLVPFLESQLYADNRIPDLDALVSPAIISTHLPYSALPQSIKDSSDCKLVYLCRNPKDVLVSRWHFVAQMAAADDHKSSNTASLEDAFEMFCAGISFCGPFWEHVLEYWKASLEKPHKVLFLKYEDLKRKPVLELKKLAEFLGHPFAPEENEQGALDDILRLCSFEHLSNLEVNKSGKIHEELKDLAGVEHRLFFRRGQVGDSSNHLTPQMIERMDQITLQKFQGSGLTFQLSD
ncbi:hypothetical protein ACLOJK_031599 [Asimina triloba]